MAEFVWAVSLAPLVVWLLIVARELKERAVWAEARVGVLEQALAAAMRDAARHKAKSQLCGGQCGWSELHTV